MKICFLKDRIKSLVFLVNKTIWCGLWQLCKVCRLKLIGFWGTTLDTIITGLLARIVEKYWETTSNTIIGYYSVLSRIWIGSPRALLERKKWRIPDWAMTSTVLVASMSLLSFLSWGPECSMVGPNTVERLCSDILLWDSIPATLQNGRKTVKFMRNKVILWGHYLTRCSMRKTMHAWFGFWGSWLKSWR